MCIGVRDCGVVGFFFGGCYGVCVVAGWWVGVRGGGGVCIGGGDYGVVGFFFFLLGGCCKVCVVVG